eukprot:TRINITY_DN11682_c0_g1_i1.p1 TRINITY_DN11682_c0_g1~~TRINITY_DN11682_c0_g1_i1.p1  ORF type:complete len:85 (-),score=13.81 TRINITY_DN11682_c0_g1_i1:203-457(-)
MCMCDVGGVLGENRDLFEKCHFLLRTWMIHVLKIHNLRRLEGRTVTFERNGPKKRFSCVQNFQKPRMIQREKSDGIETIQEWSK